MQFPEGVQLPAGEHDGLQDGEHCGSHMVLGQQLGSHGMHALGSSAAAISALARRVTGPFNNVPSFVMCTFPRGIQRANTQGHTSPLHDTAATSA